MRAKNYRSCVPNLDQQKSYFEHEIRVINIKVLLVSKQSIYTYKFVKPSKFFPYNLLVGRIGF